MGWRQAVAMVPLVADGVNPFACIGTEGIVGKACFYSRPLRLMSR